MNSLNGFKKYETEPNTLDKSGSVFTKVIHFETRNSFKDRLIRVYLPSTYDFNNPNKRFPVIYMMDGKNLFDDYTSFVGEWGIDETIEEYIKQGICDGFIVVGVDAPNENKARTLEMSFDDVPTKKRFSFGEGYANIFGDYIFKTVKPDIDRTFHTLSGKQDTYFGGSSMGGLMSFYVATHYERYIDAALCFSPAFFLLNENKFKSFLKATISKELPRLFFYVGNVGFEKVFVKTTKMTHEYLKQNYPCYDGILYFDEYKEHNETAWKEYFIKALDYILSKRKRP